MLMPLAYQLSLIYPGGQLQVSVEFEGISVGELVSGELKHIQTSFGLSNEGWLLSVWNGSDLSHIENVKTISEVCSVARNQHISMSSTIFDEQNDQISSLCVLLCIQIQMFKITV